MSDRAKSGGGRHHFRESGSFRPALSGITSARSRFSRPLAISLDPVAIDGSPSSMLFSGFASFGGVFFYWKTT
ncbi:MAG: hypothetical protein ACJA1L_002319 [Paracoccaceae bacterium]|jgi:hypothetical protein